MSAGRRFGLTGAAAAFLLLAGGQPEGRPGSAAVDTSQIANVAPVADSLADSHIAVTVSRNECRTNTASTKGPNVMLTVRNEDRLPAVVTVDFVRTPAVDGHSERTLTVPLRSGELVVSCALIPLNQSTPVRHAEAMLEVT